MKSRYPTILILLLVLITYQCGNEPGEVTIYAIGDSTMADKKPGVYPETGWCQVIDRYFDESVTIENHAVNGRSTKSFINEGRWNVVREQLEPGDYVFIQFGHNDEKEYDTTRYTDPYGAFARNLDKFVDESRARKAIPILFTPIARRKLDSTNHIIDTHGEYPDAVRRVAEDREVHLIDLERETIQWIESLGELLSRKMFVWTEPSEKYPDGRQDDTHLSEKGAMKVAGMAVMAIKESDAGLAKRIIEPNKTK